MQDVQPRGGGSTATAQQPCSMSGWLSKKGKKGGRLMALAGGGGSAWKRGFWILDASKQTLEEYSSERGDHFVSDVDPKDLVKVRKEGTDKLHLVFSSGEEDTMVLQADMESLRNRWFDMLTIFIAQMQTNEDLKTDGDSSKDEPAQTTVAPKKKKMSLIGDVKKGLSAFAPSGAAEKKKSITGAPGEKKKNSIFLGRKSNLAQQAIEENAESTASRFSLPNPVLAVDKETSPMTPSDTIGSDGTALSSASMTPRNAQSLSTASVATASGATTPSRPTSMRKKRDSAVNQIDMTKSFMSKARNFAISINKDFIESVKKKGAYTPVQEGEGERNKQRAAVVPVMAPGEKVDRARFKKTPAQNEMLLNLVLKEFAGFFGGDLLKQVDSQSIVDLMFLVTIPKDSVVVHQGEPTDKMYVVESGTVGVYTHDFVDRPPELEVERKHGDTFGVLSLIYNQVAPFMIKTHSDCTLWALPSRKFHELTTSETRRRLAQKVRLLDRVPLIADNVDGDAIAQLADSMEFKEYQQGEVVVRRGDDLKQIIVIGEGDARLTGSGENETSTLHKGDVFGEWTLLGKDFKSDFTIVAASPTLTVLCLEANDVEELVGPLKQFIIEKWMANKQQQQLNNSNFSASSGTDASPSGNVRSLTPPLEMASNSMSSILKATTSAAKLSTGSGSATKSSLIMQDGPKLSMRKQSSLVGLTTARSFIIKAGVEGFGEPPPLPPSRLMYRSSSEQYPEGPFIGGKTSVILGPFEPRTKEEEQQALEEVAREVMKSEDLLRKTRAARRATQTSSPRPPSPAFIVPAEPLNSGGVPLDLPPTTTRASGAHDGADNEDEGSENLDRPFIRAQPLRPDVTTDNLKFCALLGSGNFGKVHLVQNEDKPEEVFALKVLVRHYIVLNGWERMVENERDAMRELSTLVQSPFLLKLYNSFSDSKNIYLLLELCEGGDLYNLMRATKAKKFGEDTAKFYFACVVLGLEAMHSHDIVYRDLKPENLMIDNTGYIKVADFGLAKKTLRTFTVCGTPEYMSPETLMSRGHGLGVDWWAAGVLLYEILDGSTPFCGGESMEVYEKILAHTEVNDLTFPAAEDTEMSAETKDLIRQLLHPKKNKRLGVKYPGIDGVKSHDYFKGFDWERIATLEMSPPIIPSTTHIATMLEESNNGKPYDPRLYGAPDDHSGWTLAF